MQKFTPLLRRSACCNIRYQYRPSIQIRTQKAAMASLVNAVKSTIAENLGGPSHSLVPEHQQFSLEEVPDQTGKVAVVTGGSQGDCFLESRSQLNADPV